MVKKIFYLLLILFVSGVVMFADDNVKVEQAVDREKITIGDRIHFDIKVNIPQTYALQVPEKSENLGEWSVKDIQVYEDKKDLSKHIKYTLTAYTTGEMLIPETIVKYIDDKQKENQIKTQGMKVNIESVLSKVKGQPGLRDIAPVMSLEVPLSVYLMWFLLISVILAGAGIGYYYYKKSHAVTMPENLPPPIPPDVLAFEALEKLKNSNLIKDRKIKEFYIILIDIVRDFLKGVYGIETRDRTTSEIYSELKKKEHEKKKLAFIREFLEEGDLVKFAKYFPDEKICWQDFETGKNIIKGNFE